jgi:hypothetical protein
MGRRFWMPRSPYSSDVDPPNFVAEWLALLRLEPENLDLRLELAAAYADAGMFGNAIDQYRACLRMCPRSTDIRKSKRLLVVVRMKRARLRARHAR